LGKVEENIGKVRERSEEEEESIGRGRRTEEEKE
jgi:hypothetical protein